MSHCGLLTQRPSLAQYTVPGPQLVRIVIRLAGNFRYGHNRTVRLDMLPLELPEGSIKVKGSELTFDTERIR